MNHVIKNQPILVIGGTGYVGGRLIPRLLHAGYNVRAIARSISKMQGRPWADHPKLTIILADLHHRETLEKAIQGCRIAYYLVHSMTPEVKDFAKADRHAAQNFINVAKDSTLRRVIYLGGLGGESESVSIHLKSRHEVGKILQSSPISTTIFQSAQILGSGSASFEILRYMAERLPFMIVPDLIMDTKIQPICIRNVLNYLEGALECEQTINQTFDIGGPDVITYRQLFDIYVSEAGIRKPLFLNPPVRHSKLGRKFAIGFAKLILPIPASISEPLLEGAQVPVFVKDDRITRIIPQELMTCREAIRRAIQKDSLKIVDTRWTDAGALKPPEWMQIGDAPYAGGTLLQGGFKVKLAAAPEEVWDIVRRIGGNTGWYYGDMLWQLRGWMDQLVGGVGLRRGRRHPEDLFVGDALDFWRVLDVKPPHYLILLAEMKLPGEAILEFRIVPTDDGTELRLGTRFRPAGLYGMLYWYILLPFHNLLFGGMLKTIAHLVGHPVIEGPHKFKPGPISLN
jgi:uncharacterized protein YbjT (DUF2867 family)